MSEITNISIENIKGYGTPAVVLPIELKTNRVNLIFAPNGTGKSSLAAAFRSLTKSALEVEKNDKFHKDDVLNASLSLNLDGNILSANSTSNTISPNLICHVINCATVVHTTQRNMGKFTSVSGYIDIEDIILEPVVPIVNTGYSISVIKQEFGTNGKILSNISNDFNDNKFLLSLKSIWDQLETFGRAKYRQQLVKDVLDKVNTLSGTAQNLKSRLQNSWLSDIQRNVTYQNISKFLIEKFPHESQFDIFFRFFQLYVFWSKNKSAIKQATARAEYEERINAYRQNLQMLDTTWKNIHTEESGGNLIVRFPQADEISNGQRDLLTFIVSLIKFKIQIKENKKYLLMIDEIFDYLDDANLIAAQYYLTSFLDITKDNLFLCLLSHLNPFTFRSYVFSDKKINPQYLKNTVPTATLPFMDFISFRERINTEGKNGDQSKLSFYHQLSHDLFHYNPLQVDYSTLISSFKTETHLNEQWGKTSVLHQVLIDEVNKYLSSSQQYDPYAVALALRLRVEKLAYEMLPVQFHQEFIDAKMTKNKLNYCIEHGCMIPDMFYIVMAIHNDADHLKYDTISNRYLEKPMVYKLQNNVITTIIKKIFNWENVNLTTTSID